MDYSGKEKKKMMYYITFLFLQDESACIMYMCMVHANASFVYCMKLNDWFDFRGMSIL